jgi:hypothetical protein
MHKTLDRALKDYEAILSALELFHQERTAGDLRVTELFPQDRSGADLRVTAALLVLAARVDETDTTLDQLLPEAGRGH